MPRGPKERSRSGSQYNYGGTATRIGAGGYNLHNYPGTGRPGGGRDTGVMPPAIITVPRKR